MPTGQQVANRALTTISILEQGGTASVSDSDMVIDQLNTMWNGWSVDEGLIWAVVPARFPTTAGLGIYTIGPSPSSLGATPNFNSQIPARIYGAQFITVSAGAIASSSLGDGGLAYVVNDTGIIVNGSGQVATYTVNTVSASGAVLTYTISGAGTGFLPGNGYLTQVGGGQPGIGSGLTINVLTVTVTGQNRNPLKIVNETQYRSHKDLAASAQVPDEIYPDYNPDQDGFSRLYTWPVSTLSVAALELNLAVPFQQWTLTGNYNLTPSLADAINYALAYRLISVFGVVVAPQIIQQVTQLAEKAELRYREMNKSNRQLTPGTEMLVPPQEAKA